VTYDLCLKNARIVDGTGAPAFSGDVVIQDGIIAEVGTVSGQARRTLDCAGLVVAPGFIDIHTHFDAQVLWEPLLGTSARHGVTTAVMGHCGYTLAPVQPGDAEFLIQMLARVEGMPVPALEQGLSWSWHSFGDYLDQVDQPLGMNIIPLVGHSALRYFVMGPAATERAATEEEIARMQAVLEEALSAGAWGYSSTSSGSHYDTAGRPVPSRQAEPAEFEALATVVGRFPFGILQTSPGTRFKGIAPEERQLLTRMSLLGKAPLNWGQLIYQESMPDLWRWSLDACREANQQGARVSTFFFPPARGVGRFDLESAFVFDTQPHWKPVLRLPKAEKMAAFRDPQVRADLRADIEGDSMGFINAIIRKMWDRLTVTQVFSEENRPLVGRTVADIATERGQYPMDTMLDIGLADNLQTSFMQQSREAENTEVTSAILHDPDVIYGGSDAGAHLDMMDNGAFGVRTIADRVRGDGMLTLEEAVHRLSGDLARRFGITGRGEVRTGMAADLVVFDPDRLDVADVQVVNDLPGGSLRLKSESTGLHYTIVNGDVVFESGQHTGALPGRLLRAGKTVAASSAGQAVS
jgi:N-acyl-D-aspartate/D-glutamate deacylase